MVLGRNNTELSKQEKGTRRPSQLLPNAEQIALPRARCELLRITELCSLHHRGLHQLDPYTLHVLLALAPEHRLVELTLFFNFEQN